MAYLFDAETGDRLRIFDNPSPECDDQFGYSIAGFGNYVLVGAPRDHSGQNEGGAAYLFDATTGELLDTYLNPTPQTGDKFGFSVASVGNNVLIGSLDDEFGGTGRGTAYLFPGPGVPKIHSVQFPTQQFSRLPP